MFAVNLLSRRRTSPDSSISSSYAIRPDLVSLDERSPRLVGVADVLAEGWARRHFRRALTKRVEHRRQVVGDDLVYDEVLIFGPPLARAAARELQPLPIHEAGYRRDVRPVLLLVPPVVFVFFPGDRITEHELIVGFDLALGRRRGIALVVDNRADCLVNRARGGGPVEGRAQNGHAGL